MGRSTCWTRPPSSPPSRKRSPTAEQTEQFYEHLERTLLLTGFLDPQNPRLLMRRLRTLFNRAQPDLNELNLLRGVLTTVEKTKQRRQPERAAGE